MDTIYRNIHFLRIQNDMTQEELAEKTGYANKSTIARIEKGDVDLPLSKVADFAKALGVTSEQLLGWDESEKQSRIIDMISDMDDEMLNRLIGYIEAIKDMKR